MVSPLANLLVAPVVPFAMLGAVIGAVVGPLLLAPAAGLLLAPLLLGSWLPLALMTRGAGLLAQVPLANVELAPPFDLAGAAIATVALATALRLARRPPAIRHVLQRAKPVPARATVPPGRRRRLGAVAAAIVLVATVSIVLVSRPLPALQVSVLDVGQGDAILLQASDGSRMLVDGGPDPDLLVRRLDERIPVWDRSIDFAVLTHPHEDHAGGLAGLTPRYTLGRIAETGMPSGGSGITRTPRRGGPSARHAGPSRHRRYHAAGRRPRRRAVAAASGHPRRTLSDGRAVNGTSIVLRSAWVTSASC